MSALALNTKIVPLRLPTAVVNSGSILETVLEVDCTGFEFCTFYVLIGTSDATGDFSNFDLYGSNDGTTYTLLQAMGTPAVPRTANTESAFQFRVTHKWHGLRLGAFAGSTGGWVTVLAVLQNPAKGFDTALPSQFGLNVLKQRLLQ